MRRTLLALAALAPALCWCQTQDKPETQGAPVDLRDPVAVVQAYLQACEKLDIDGALALISAEEGVLERLRWMLTAMQGNGQGDLQPDFQTMMSEISLLPLGSSADTTMRRQLAQGATAVVVATENQPAKREFVLTRAEDGGWKIDLEKSIIRTTGEERSYFFQKMTAVGRQAHGPDDWRMRDYLRKLAGAVMAYARDHGNLLPEADTWMDDLEAYCLDKSLLKRPDAGENEYGYALNSDVAGQLPPTDWRLGQNTVLLFESTDNSRNAVRPLRDELDEAIDTDRSVIVALASQQVCRIPPGLTIHALAEIWQHSNTCSQRVRALCKALLAYARDNEGTLPAAESWCDDIALYIEPEAGDPQVFRCPERPDLEYAYAINRQLAGTDIRELEGHDSYVLLLPAEEGVRNEALEVPLTVNEGWHLRRWDFEARMSVTVGMLDGNTRAVHEGEPFPAPQERRP